MIRVCDSCSEVNVAELKKVVAKDDLHIGCISLCGDNAGKAFGYINDELVIKDTSEEFIDAVKAVK